MELAEFEQALKKAKKTKESAEDLLRKKQEQENLELSKREDRCKIIWEALQEVVDEWEEVVIQHLNLLGEQYWGKEEFMECEKVNRQDISHELFNMCVSQIHENLEILWYIEGRPQGTGFKIRYPIFCIVMMVEMLPEHEEDIFKYYLMIVDYAGVRRCIEYPKQLQEAIIEAVANGPTYRCINTDWL